MISLPFRTVVFTIYACAGSFVLSACTDNDPANSPAGPGVKVPPGAVDNVEPAVGGPAGHGGGVSGGAASGAVSH